MGKGAGGTGGCLPGLWRQHHPGGPGKGAQALITGDIGHHAGIDAAAQGLMIIDAGHYGLEHIFMDYMEGYLRQRLGDQIQILKMPVHFPAAVV